MLNFEKKNVEDVSSKVKTTVGRQSRTRGTMAQTSKLIQVFVLRRNFSLSGFDSS